MLWSNVAQQKFYAHTDFKGLEGTLVGRPQVFLSSSLANRISGFNLVWVEDPGQQNSDFLRQISEKFRFFQAIFTKNRFFQAYF